MKKTVYLGLLLVIIGVGAYFYVAFFGTPWKKATTAKELEVYVEKKYDIQVTLKEPFYNFKDSSYGATFTVGDQKELSFTAEQLWDGAFSDYYPESVWVKEAEEDMAPILDQSFPSLSIDTYRINPVYGMGDELVKGKEIPSYKTVGTGIDIGIHFKENWTKETEAAIVKEGFVFIASLKEKGVRNIGIRLYLKDEEIDEQVSKTFSILIEAKDFETIQTEQDMEKYTTIF